MVYGSVSVSMEVKAQYDGANKYLNNSTVHQSRYEQCPPKKKKGKEKSLHVKRSKQEATSN